MRLKYSLLLRTARFTYKVGEGTPLVAARNARAVHQLARAISSKTRANYRSFYRVQFGTRSEAISANLGLCWSAEFGLINHLITLRYAGVYVIIPYNAFVVR